MYDIKDINTASKVIIFNQKNMQAKVLFNQFNYHFKQNGHEPIKLEDLTDVLNQYGNNPDLKITVIQPNKERKRI